MDKMKIETFIIEYNDERLKNFYNSYNFRFDKLDIYLTSSVSNYSNNKICININLNGYSMHDILYHELGHFIWEEMEISPIDEEITPREKYDIEYGTRVLFNNAIETQDIFLMEIINQNFNFDFIKNNYCSCFSIKEFVAEALINIQIKLNSLNYF